MEVKWEAPRPAEVRFCEQALFQERVSDLIGPYWGTFGIVYRVLQPSVGWE